MGLLYLASRVPIPHAHSRSGYSGYLQPHLKPCALCRPFQTGHGNWLIKKYCVEKFNKKILRFRVQLTIELLDASPVVVRQNIVVVQRLVPGVHERHRVEGVSQPKRVTKLMSCHTEQPRPFP